MATFDEINQTADVGIDVNVNGVHAHNGGHGNQTAGPQINEFDMTNLAIREANYEKPFTQMAGKPTLIKRNHGDEYKKYRVFPVIDPRNEFDQGVGPDGLVMKNDKWYSWTDWSDGTTRQEHDTQADAEARAGQIKVTKGAGNLYGGSKDFFIIEGAIPDLREQGGVVNVIGSKRIIYTAKIRPFGLSEEFSVDELEIGGDSQIKTTKSMELGRAFGELREAMVQNDLLNQALTNAMYVGIATNMSEVDKDSIVGYSDLRAYQRRQDLLKVPFSSKILSGSTTISSVSVGAGRFYYIPIDLEPTIEGITGGTTETSFKFVNTYIKSGGSIIDRENMLDIAAFGEIGAVGKARFISSYNMPVFRGQGAPAVFEDGVFMTDGKTDVAPILSVGSGSFEILGLQGQDLSIKYAPPKITPGVDNYGLVGVVSVRWWYGIIFNKPEQVTCLLTAIKA